MSLLRNIGRLAKAPLDIIDELEVKPLADVAEAVVKGIKGETK